MALMHGQVEPDAESHGTKDNGALMAAAMMRTRDAIAGIELITPLPGEDGTLSATDRLKRMDSDHRRSIFTGEILEDLSFTTEAYTPDKNVARAITLLRRKAGGGPLSAEYTPLARIIRPGVDDFSKATPLVAAYAELRADRLAEILVQKQHLVPFFASIIPIDKSRTPAVMEMLEIALAVITPVVMRIKIALGCPRSTQFSDRIQPMIPVETHPTLPSGHATQMFTLATLLTLLQDPQTQVMADSQLYRLACRIAINRTVAGVHFPADNASGAVLGIQLGRYLMARGLQGGPAALTVGSADWDGTAFHDGDRPRDFHYAILNQMVAGTDAATSFADDGTDVRPAPMWSSLIARARDEWGNRWN